MKPTPFRALLFAALVSPIQAQASGLQVADLDRLADVAEPDLSKDGRWLAYSVTRSNVGEDVRQSDLWRVAYAGGDPQQLSFTDTDSEWLPQWSPDGRWLAFLSDRASGDDKLGDVQVWMMAADGGEARRVTRFAGAVEDFVWSPDGKALAVIAEDAEVDHEAAKNPPPIVIDRYQFKEDGRDYLGQRRRHLYRVEVATGESIALTSGAHDEQLPAWSPDGRHIAFVSKRGDDPDRHLNFDLYLIEPKPGAVERQLTRFAGADLDPYWETRPAWSPDSRRIAYLQSGEDRWIYYAPWQLAVIDVASGESHLPAPIDRCFSKPHWSKDGRSVYALVEQSRVTRLSRIDLRSGKVTPLSPDLRFDYDLDVEGDRLVVLGGDDLNPYEISALEGKGLRSLTHHNDWLSQRRLARTEALRFASADGTVIEGLLTLPLDHDKAQPAPLVVRLHGGPVYQFSHEFMPDWQIYAAQGYAVLAVNPRGSSGRGFDFSKAIYADWGRLDVADVIAGVEHVVERGIADPNRLAVSGWSYGGILTNAVIARDTRFKAAVSGAGASNMYALYGHDMYIREYELELGTPWANRDAYDAASYPFLHANQIKTPTLFLCAEKDFNVPCLGGEQMYQTLRSQNIPTRLVIYPGENHGLSVPSYLRDRMQRHLDWYAEYLH